MLSANLIFFTLFTLNLFIEPSSFFINLPLLSFLVAFVSDLVMQTVKFLFCYINSFI